MQPLPLTERQPRDARGRVRPQPHRGRSCRTTPGIAAAGEDRRAPRGAGQGAGGTEAPRGRGAASDKLEAGTASGTEAAAVREAQPVPDAVPKPLDLPAAWTLPVDELIKAGDVVARKAAAKWGVADSSPTAMPLDGIDGVPVLTFTPVRGLLRKQPASWRYEDAGRYAGEAAIETRAARLHRQEPRLAQLDSRSRGVVARARDRRPRGRRGNAALAGRAVPGPRRGIRAENPHQEISRGKSPDLRGRDVRRQAARRGDHDLEKRRPLRGGVRERPSPRPGRLRLSGRQALRRPMAKTALRTRRKASRPGRADGPRYEGAFENDAIATARASTTIRTAAATRAAGGRASSHGPGIEIAADGQRAEGVWEDGKRAEAAAKKTQTRSRGRGRGEGR